MTGERSTTRFLTIAVAGLLALPVLAVAQEAPETAWGAPDLQGVWDFRTITPLQRPSDLGDKEFLTEEEAAEREARAVQRDQELLERDAQRTEAGGSIGAYNNFWMTAARATSARGGPRSSSTRRTAACPLPPSGDRRATPWAAVPSAPTSRRRTPR